MNLRTRGEGVKQSEICADVLNGSPLALLKLFVPSLCGPISRKNHLARDQVEKKEKTGETRILLGASLGFPQK